MGYGKPIANEPVSFEMRRELYMYSIKTVR